MASSLVVIALMVGFAGPPTDPPWEDIIRDAQIANMSTIRGGRYHFRMEAAAESWKSPVLLEGEFAWNGESSVAEFQIRDPEGVLLGMRSDDLKRYKAGVIATLGSSHYAFNPSNKVLIVRDRAPSHPPPMLQLRPDAMWFRCCPPNAGQTGRPWPEMVGPLPAASTGGIRGTVDFQEVAPELIRQTRRDPSGFVFEIDFSLRDCGLPTRIRSSAPPRSPFRTTRGDYRWKHLGKACVIESIEMHSFAPGRPDHEIESFKLEVRDVVLESEPSRFTEQALLGRIRGGFTVQDYRTDPKHKPIAPRVAEPDYSDSAKDLLDQGFLKKNKKSK